VTGEAVALELRPAKLPSRTLAVLLDLIVATIVYVVVTIGLVASTGGLDEAAQVALSIACFLLVLVGGPIAVETSATAVRSEAGVRAAGGAGRRWAHPVQACAGSWCRRCGRASDDVRDRRVHRLSRVGARAAAG